MTDNAWDESVRNALQALEKPKWHQPLDDLCQRFHGVEFETSSIHDEVEMALWDLVALNRQSDYVPLTRLFQRRISELECWSCRAISTDGQPIFWNPLDQPFSAFDQAHEGNIHQYTASHSYPAKDVIRKWAETQFV